MPKRARSRAIVRVMPMIAPCDSRAHNRGGQGRGAVASPTFPGQKMTPNERQFREQYSIPTPHMARVLFRAIDVDQSGDITPEEYTSFLEELTSEQSDPSGVVALFIQLADVDGNGSL